MLVVCFTVLILPVGRIKVKVKKRKMAAELVKMYKNLQHYCVLVIFRGMLFVNEIYRRSGKCGTKSRICMNSVHRGEIILHGVDSTSFGGKNEKKVALHNLGCKVNSYELEAMQQLLEQAGV